MAGFPNFLSVGERNMAGEMPEKQRSRAAITHTHTHTHTHPVDGPQVVSLVFIRDQLPPDPQGLTGHNVKNRPLFHIRMAPKEGNLQLLNNRACPGKCVCVCVYVCVYVCVCV